MTEEELRKLREEMVLEQICGRGVRDVRVLEAMRKVPRHRFVPQEDIQRAYGDHPLSIGQGQTISQPYMVALMTEQLSLEGNEKVLEIGTGSGYQTAILAELADGIYTVERIRVLQDRAKETLQELGYSNIYYRVGDGTRGWEEEAPFDRIIVTAGAPHIPKPLLEQLADGGVLVIPVGSAGYQMLERVERRGNGFKEEEVCSCTFVKLIGKDGWNELEA